MAAREFLLLCSLLWMVTAAEKKEFTMTCGASEDCVLPCRFLSDGKGARIMWYKKKAVVSCTRYGNTSFVVGHNSPAEKYVGRTGLYADQVLEGNATLLLRNVTPNDEGKYFCITMTAPRTDESGVISLVVEAPVRDVDMEFNGEGLTCAASGVYPAPTLTWTTEPPSDVQLLQKNTNSQKNKLGFYHIQSSLRLMGKIATGHTYICSVACDINKKTAFLKHEGSLVVTAGSEVKISCMAPHAVLQTFNLTWMLGRARPIVSVVKEADRTPRVRIWDPWKSHVFTNFSVWSGLQLHSLGAEQQGNYSCEVITPEDKFITWTEVKVTKDYQILIFIIVIVILVILCLLAYILLGIFGCKWFKLEQAMRIRESKEGTMESLSVQGAADNTDKEEEIAAAAEEAETQE